MTPFEPYLRQPRDSMDCVLYAFLNACLFYKIPIEGKRPGQPGYEIAQIAGGCTDVGCSNYAGLAEFFGIHMTLRRLPDEEFIQEVLRGGACIKWTMSTPKWKYHSALIVGYKEGLYEVVNAQYHSNDVDIEWLTWDELNDAPGNGFRILATGCATLYPNIAEHDTIGS